MVKEIELLAQTLERQVPGISISIEKFASGGLFMDIRLNERLVVLEFRPSEGIGVSAITNNTPGFNSGHDHIFPSIEGVERCILALLAADVRH